MGKKKSARHANGSAADTAGDAAGDANGSLRPVLAVATHTATAHEALQSTLAQLDAIAQEAYAYVQQQRQASAAAATAEADGEGAEASARKRPRVESLVSQLKGSRLDVFAATSAVHHQALCSAVATYGLQLLPSLEDMLKRVALAVLTPSLSTPEAWEAMALLCTTYRAGAAHALTELLESLLREPGVFLLDAPQLVPVWYAEALVHAPTAAAASNTATAALGNLLAFAEDQRLREEPADAAQHAARLHTARTARKLHALADMLCATGGYVPAATLQHAALRHALEVVEAGMLPAYVSEVECAELVHTAEPASGSSAPLRWRVPAAWHAVSLQLLEAFLFTCRPALPAQLLVTTTRVMDVLAARLHRGMPLLQADAAEGAVQQPLPVTAAVGAAVVRLGHVAQLLRHPVVLPPYQPAQLVVEKAKRRVFVVAADAPAEPPVPPAAAASVEPQPAAPVPAPVAPAPASPPPPQPPAPAAAARAAAAAPAPVAARPAPPRPAAPQQQRPAKAAPPPPPRAAPVAAADEVDDEIPDIVMED